MTQFNNEIEQAAFMGAKTAQQPQQQPDRYDSRTADKFVLRMPDVAFDYLEVLARRNGRSLNAEILAAVSACLEHSAQLETQLKVLKHYLGVTASCSVLAGVEVYAIAPRQRLRKFVLRLPPNVRELVSLTVDAGGMNRWFAYQAVAWINHQRQVDALMLACSEVEELALKDAS